mgnify:CR=1 FL=1
MEKYKIEKDSVQETLIIRCMAGGSARGGFPDCIRIRRRPC